MAVSSTAPEGGSSGRGRHNGWTGPGRGRHYDHTAADTSAHVPTWHTSGRLPLKLPAASRRVPQRSGVAP